MWEKWYNRVWLAWCSVATAAEITVLCIGTEHWRWHVMLLAIDIFCVSVALVYNFPKIMCRFGFHDYHVVPAGPDDRAGANGYRIVKKIACSRCGDVLSYLCDMRDSDAVNALYPDKKKGN